MSATRRLLQSFASGARESDLMQIEDGQTKILRFYRFEVVGDDGKITRELCVERQIHFHGKGQRPTDCPGPDLCNDCKRAAALDASGTKQAREEAKGLRAATQADFVVVDMANPTKFWMLSLGFGAVQKIIHEFAKAGGWVQEYPDKKEDEAVLGAFDQAFERGIPKVCGPSGRDLILTYNKGKAAKTWTVVQRYDENKVLPYQEDGNVLSPIELRQKLSGSVKEGDD